MTAPLDTQEQDVATIEYIVAPAVEQEEELRRTLQLGEYVFNSSGTDEGRTAERVIKEALLGYS